MIKNKKIIIFDLDGVILDSIDFVREYMFYKYEGMTDKDFKNIFLTNFWDGLNNFREIARKEYTIHEEYSKNSRANNKDVIIFKKMKESIEYLSKKYLLVINSSDRKNDIIERLRFNNMLDFFDFIAGEEVSKNKTEKFNIILEKYNVSPREVIFITDTIGDIIESDKVGVDSIAVTWGVHSREDFGKQKFSNLILILDEIDDLKIIF